MARTVVGYINPFLNKMASASPTGSVEVVTGASIGTGLDVGQFQEFSDGAAALYSSKQVNSVQILTAGSGQTAGTYTLTASAGGAQISVVVAGGGTVTAVPTIISGGKYTTDTTPTFTLAAGGTPATFAVNLGYLYSGNYAWCQLDPAVTGSILVGQPLYWLATSSSLVVTTTASGNFPDFAGISIDPGFSATLPYAWVQLNGKAKCLYDSTVAAVGNIVNLAGTPGATVVALATGSPNGAVTNLTLGSALSVNTTLSTGLVRIYRSFTRY